MPVESSGREISSKGKSPSQRIRRKKQAVRASSRIRAQHQIAVNLDYASASSPQPGAYPPVDVMSFLQTYVLATYTTEPHHGEERLLRDFSPLFSASQPEDRAAKRQKYHYTYFWAYAPHTLSTQRSADAGTTPALIPHLQSF